jgi:porphobilinogen deaminase
MPLVESERLVLALAAACEDPIGVTAVYGEDDGVVRMLVTEHAIAVLPVGQITKTLTVLQLSYTG